MAITFIEGLPCAGKSLLTEAICSEGLPVVPELGSVFNQMEFPGNGNSLEEIQEIDQWFIHEESKRMTNEGFFDRSYLTHVTFAFAYGNYREIPSSFARTVETYSTAIEQARLRLPDNVVYVDTTPEISIERQLNKISLGKQGLDGFWRSKVFLDDLVTAYGELFKSFIGIRIVQLPSEESTELKLHRLMEQDSIVSAPEPITRHIDLNKYLTRLS